MQVDLTSEDLIAFEEEVCRLWAEKKIKAPIHLDNGNEEPLLSIFRDHVSPEDWCCGSWRMHYKALIKGVPREELLAAILAGRSIGLCFPEYRVVASAIVTGVLPIALGIALGIKRQGGTNKVVCFVGDMTSESGVFHECLKYSVNHRLPVVWCLEDNNVSVCTNTAETWGAENSFAHSRPDNVLYFRYKSRFPHAGVGGARIQF